MYISDVLNNPGDFERFFKMHDVYYNDKYNTRPVKYPCIAIIDRIETHSYPGEYLDMSYIDLSSFTSCDLKQELEKRCIDQKS